MSPLVPPCSAEVPCSDSVDAVKARAKEAEVDDKNAKDNMPTPPLPDDPIPEVEARSESADAQPAADTAGEAPSVEGDKAGIETRSLLDLNIEPVDSVAVAPDAPTADPESEGGGDSDSSSGSDYGRPLTIWEANGLAISPDEQQRIDQHEEKMRHERVERKRANVQNAAELRALYEDKWVAPVPHLQHCGRWPSAVEEGEGGGHGRAQRHRRPRSSP